MKKIKDDTNGEMPGRFSQWNLWLSPGFKFKPHLRCRLLFLRLLKSKNLKKKKKPQMEKYPVFINWKNNVKISLLPKASFRFNTIHINISMVFFIEGEKAILKFIWNRQRPQEPKSWGKKRIKEVSHFLISSYTIKLQASKQDGSGIKTEK